jgi:nucleoside-diphosphate-sugar epimerase
MKILITGPHGFVGKNLVKSLCGDNELYGLARQREPMDGLRECFDWGDLDRGTLPGVDAIVHLAGKAHDTRNSTAAEVYFRVNRDLTVKLYHYFLEHKAVRTFVFFSSVKAAADKVTADCLVEDVTPAPAGPYGESKRQAEDYVLHHPCQDGRRVLILRPCMMHGPGNKGNLNLLYKVLSLGLPWPLGAFDNRRSFASIDNVVYVVRRLLEEEVPSGIYNLADDESLSTNELVDVVCGALGRKAHIWKFGRGFMTLAARAGDALHLPLNTERLAKLTENYVVSNTKIKQALHIGRMPVRARDGLARTIRSFVNG